ncbi:MAG: lipid-binding SYLF domain-containing protein [Pseudomonadota bacterium]
MILALGLLVGLANPVSATTAREVVVKAGVAVEAFLGEMAPDDPIRAYVQNAFAVVVMPGVIRGGFFLGAEHGFGVMLVRDTVSGRFGPPAFVELFSGSLGIQFGGQTSDAIVTVMNPDAVERLLTGDVKLGADMGIAVARLGRNVGASTTGNFKEDLYVFQRSIGLFGGAALSGGGLVPQNLMNRDYWGDDVVLAELVRDFDRVDQRTADLQHLLTRF